MTDKIAIASPIKTGITIGGTIHAVVMRARSRALRCGLFPSSPPQSAWPSLFGPASADPRCAGKRSAHFGGGCRSGRQLPTDTIRKPSPNFLVCELAGVDFGEFDLRAR